MFNNLCNPKLIEEKGLPFDYLLTQRQVFFGFVSVTTSLLTDVTGTLFLLS